MSAKKATDTVKKTAPAKAAETAAALVKDAAEKAEPAKTAPVKEAVKEDKAPAKKAAAPKKAAAKTTTTKTAKTVKEAASQNVYIQFAGKEVKTEELVEQVKALWTAQGHRVSSIKSLEVYVKPEDAAAYYVINGKENGKIEL
ncbi:MAG: hypothetical protein HFI23_07195 [Lachnospiraceae bacterium]|uniref:DUF6465 family protein n=1 Tax=Candidatus Merdisoma sp. JLR.KK011 TaxID=3114299 RepID=UPI0029DD8E14|nr:hypothetical protein [Lachnospiraceae bacterium]MCI9623105.1 hypothetical protein [Lachnospiraceae bacterium]